MVILQWVMSHLGLFISIAISVISEVIAIRQMLKYPDNDSVGGILAGVLKFLKGLA
jgi:hypothetical protein